MQMAQKMTIFGLDFTYHINEVSTAGHPLNEAGFLERSTNIGARFSSWDKQDVDTISLGGEAFIEDFYVSAGVDFNSNPSGVSDTTDFGVKVGFLPTDGLLLTLGYDIEEDGQFKKGKIKDLNTISLGGKYVTPLDGEMALNLEGEVGFQDDDDDTVVYTLGGDLYFNSAISAGLWLADSDESGSKTLVGVRGKYFVTPLVSVEAAYSKQDKVDTFGLRAALRF